MPPVQDAATAMAAEVVTRVVQDALALHEAETQAAEIGENLQVEWHSPEEVQITMEAPATNSIEVTSTVQIHRLDSYGFQYKDSNEGSMESVEVVSAAAAFGGHRAATEMANADQQAVLASLPEDLRRAFVESDEMMMNESLSKDPLAATHWRRIKESGLV